MPVCLPITIAVAFLVTLLVRRVAGWLKFRGDRIVRCPENHRPAGERVDAWRAANGLALSACSRWPEKAGCGQECLAEIAAAPADCLVRNIAARWYAGKQCASCGTEIGAVEWGPSQPGLLLADESIVPWKQVSADVLRETLETARPLCFTCYLANTLAREHPELATARNRPKES